MGSFEIYKGEDGLFYWRLKSSNGEVIANGEGYDTRENAVRGVNTVEKTAFHATIVHLAD